ncbi:MAG: sodium:solute symporter family protein [Pseudomonadota bacterium]
MIGPTGQVVIGIYLLSLLLLGWLGRRARQADSLADFYLAGRGLGLATLFLSLYATQYSGNALVGYPATAYRQGFQFLNSLTFMLGIVGVYWLFAGRLHRLARAHSYVTPGDLIRHRYGSRRLALVLNIVFIAVLASYILANLKAIGQVLQAVTDGQVDFAVAVWCAAVVMVVYESLGGMRSVAWTDAIQGVLLLAGCLTIFVALEVRFDGISNLLTQLRTVRPEFWDPPGATDLARYASLIIVVAFGAAVYPQAIQRIYAARSGPVLRRSLQLLLVMPLLTITLVLIIGYAGAALVPGLDRAASEGITLAVLADLITAVPELRWMFVLFLAAALAAIMSTVDSALLSLSSIFAQDLYGARRPDATQSQLTRAGKVFSWIIMALMATLAIYLPQTIWQLTVIKLEVLCQAAPAVIAAVQSRRPSAPALVAGVVTGLVVVLGLRAAAATGWLPSDSPGGFESGLLGLLANVFIVWLVGKNSRTNLG